MFLTVRLCLLVCQLLSQFFGTTQGIRCEGEYIDSHCINIRVDGKSWPRSEEACSKYSIKDYVPGHLVSVPSLSRHNKLVGLAERVKIGAIWMGAKRNKILWKWLDDETDIIQQGCYSGLNNTARFYNISSDTPLDTTEKCLDRCFGAIKGYAAVMNGVCFCGDELRRTDRAVKCGVDTFEVYRLGGLPAVWAQGEPADQNTDACIYIRQGYGLGTMKCKELNRYICEYASTKTHCDPPNHKIDTGCYRLSSRVASWSEARSACEKIDASLVSLGNLQLLEYIEQWIALQRTTSNIWVGGYKSGWYWLGANTFSFTNWKEGEPRNESLFKEQCLVMDMNDGYKWTTKNCSYSPMYFFCQVGLTYAHTNTKYIIREVPNFIEATTQSDVITPQLMQEEVKEKRLGSVFAYVIIAFMAFLILLFLLCLALCCFSKKRSKTKVTVDTRGIANQPDTSSTGEIIKRDQLDANT